MNQPRIQAVLFDLDDTLWPIVPVIRRADSVLQAWMDAHAPAVTRQFSVEQLRAMRAQLQAGEPRYLLDLWSLRHATLTLAFEAAGADLALVDSAMAVFSKARNDVTPFSDALTTLRQLAGRVRLGSISNGFADLEEIGIAHHFHYSIAAHQSGCAKPDPVIFQRACAALGVAPAQAVYVGDDPALDVEGAQKAGLLGVWLNHAELGRERVLPAHIRPDAVCTSLLELQQWLAPRTSECSKSQ